MYTVLNENLQVKGRLSQNNGQGSTAFFADTVVQQLATDNSNDPASLTSLDFNQLDKKGNAKQWNHTLNISIEATGLGQSINTKDYLMYFDAIANHYYLMKVLDVVSDRNSGYVTVSAINSAIYELGKQLVNNETTYPKSNLKDFVNKVYNNVPFSLRIQDDLLTVIDYTISANTSLQAVLQDLQTKYDVDIDSWVEVDNTGNITERVLYFGHLGQDNGELIRYGGAKGFENMTATEVSDIIYTKIYVTGKTDDKDIVKGHIGSVNNGLEYIVDDDANQRIYAVGASQQQPVYLEGTITNELLSEPQALLDWAKQQMDIFNHPRFNYTVTPMHDQIVTLGDAITVQDFHIKPEILVTSKVIQKSTSFSSPETNTFVLGEFSSIFSDRASKNNMVIEVIKKDITVVQEAADYAKAQADEAHRQAVTAQEQAIHAQTSADGKTMSFTVASVEDLPVKANEGDIAWVTLEDGTHGYTFINGHWIEDINPNLKKSIQDGVTTAISTAKSDTEKAIADNNTSINNTVNEVAQEKIDLAIKDADFNNKAQAMADKALSDAKANTTTVAQETLNSANQNLADAKKSLTDNISKEASDRASAVAAANSQAQTYANQAKADALNAIAKEVTDRQNAVSALDTKATNAVNQAKSDITDTINAISVGGRNLLMNTGVSRTGTGSNSVNGNFNTQGFLWGLGGKNVSDLYNLYGVNGYLTLSFDWVASGSTISGTFNPQWNNTPWGGLSINGAVKLSNTNTSGHYENTVPLRTSGYSTGTATGVMFRQDNLQGNIIVTNLKLESGNKATDWTPAPEDVVLDYTTKDSEIKTTISQYQTTNDGKVGKAQTDATTALGLVATKVSQTDYDTKTGDLTTKYTQVKQTADSQATDIADIKETATSQSSKINSISSDVDGTKQSISDIETTQDSQSDKINQITSDVNGTKQSITDIQTKDGKQDTRMGTIETSVSGVKSDFSTYKTDANGRIGTAQTTAQTAVDGLKTKVSQTDYNTKTGQLQTDLTTTTQTANQAKTDIASIKQTDTTQDARMTTIESDASGVKTTVSDLQSAQGKQSGAISTLQQRADGFDATVTKVDNLSVGGRNYFLNSKTSIITPPGTANWDWRIIISNDFWSNPDRLKSNNIRVSFTLTAQKSLTTDFNSSLYFSASPWPSKPISYPAGTTAPKKYELVFNITDPAFKTDNCFIRFQAKDTSANPFILENAKLEIGATFTDWTPAPEDVDSATAKAQLTADQATTALNNYKINADGRISKAQADIVQTAKDVTTKVSQTDYDEKTGDLTTAVSKAQTTADGVVTTVGNYKTSNDARVKAAESAISQNYNDITARVTKTDYDNDNSKLNTRFTKVEATADGASTTVSELQQTVNSLGQNNLINNSDFVPDLDGWYFNGNGSYSTGDYVYSEGAVLVVANTGGGIVNLYSTAVPLNGAQSMTLSWSLNYYIFSVGTGGSSYIYMQYLDSNRNPVPDIFIAARDVSGNSGGWKRHVINNFVLVNIPSNAKYIRLVVDARNLGTKIGINRPMLVKSTNVGPYVSGRYNSNGKIASQQITIDGITNIVSNPTTGLSTRVQTAEGTLNTVKSTADGAMSKASQTANDIKQEIENRKTGDNNTLQSSKDFTQSQITSAVNGVNSTITQTANGILASIGTTNLFPNSEFEQDYGYQKKDNGTTLSLDSKSNIDGKYNGTVHVTNSAGKNLYLGYWADNIAVQGGQVYSASTVVHFESSGTGRALLDIWFVDKDNKRISSASSTLTASASPFWRTITSENFKAPVNAVYMQVSLLVMNNGDGIQTASFTQPMVTATAKVQSYTPNDDISSQLALFKDNWSIGINDNIGKITSGIVGNASQMSLISKNVTIDSPSTQITGTAWINSAMIQNGAIGSAQIGDAVITSAKIANLDVSKLTGDTITGFNFNVNRSMNIASGGVIKSDVINMDKTSFILNTSTVATDTVTTAANNKMILSNITYNIDSTKGAIISSGKVNISRTNGSTSNANFDFRIAPDYFSMSSKNWSDGVNDNYMTMTDYGVAFLAGSPLIDKASSYSNVSQDGIATTGTVLADAISGHGSKPMYINAGGTLRLAANDGSGVKVYISNTNVQTDSPIISGNITLNTGHAIVSNDNGKMFFYGSNGNQIDLGVKSLSQSSLVSLKENISKVVPKQLLSETLRADIRSYNFTGDDITDKHVTPMIDDVNHEMYIPNDWLSPEGTGVDTYSVIGYLIGSVKALQEQITELKANQ